MLEHDNQQAHFQGNRRNADPDFGIDNRDNGAQYPPQVVRERGPRMMTVSLCKGNNTKCKSILLVHWIMFQFSFIFFFLFFDSATSIFLDLLSFFHAISHCFFIYNTGFNGIFDDKLLNLCLIALCCFDDYTVGVLFVVLMQISSLLQLQKCKL